MNENQEQDFELIVERVLILIKVGSGAKEEIKIRIGRPYWVEENIEAVCPISFDGLHPTREHIHGIDPLNALELAIRFSHRFLSNRSPNEKFFWTDGEEYSMDGM